METEEGRGDGAVSGTAGAQAEGQQQQQQHVEFPVLAMQLLQQAQAMFGGAGGGEQPQNEKVWKRGKGKAGTEKRGQW